MCVYIFSSGHLQTEAGWHVNMGMCVYMLVHQVIIRLKLACTFLYLCMCIYMLVHHIVIILKLACKYLYTCVCSCSSGWSHSETDLGMCTYVFTSYQVRL